MMKEIDYRRFLVGIPLLFFITALLLMSCANAPVKPEGATLGDYEYTKQYLSWLIQKEMKKNNVTGLSIALVDDQRESRGNE